MPFPPQASFAPDMGCFGLRLPVAQIVLLSWIVAEYDGLGFVKTENAALEMRDENAAENSRKGRDAYVSLFFPEKKRDDVLELLGVLTNEGLEISFLFEQLPSSYSAKDSATERTLEDFDTL